MEKLILPAILGTAVTAVVVSGVLSNDKNSNDTDPIVSCKKNGDTCTNTSECCTSYACIQGRCLNINLKPKIDAFLLSATKDDTIIYDGLFKTGTNTVFDNNVTAWWSWGETLMYKTKAVGVDKIQYLTTNTNVPSLTSVKTQILIGENNTIYNEDYSKCLVVENKQLVWKIPLMPMTLQS